MKVDYSFEVLEIVNDQATGEQGAMVRYVPDDQSLDAYEVFVSVPWRKCTDGAHARQIMQQKIRARAPMAAWRKDAERANPPVDNSEAITNELAREAEPIQGRGSAGESDTEGRAGITRVSRSDTDPGQRE